MNVNEAHTDAASFRLLREQIEAPVVARFTIDGEPASKSRARFTHRGSKIRSYTPAKTKQAEEAVARAFRAAEDKSVQRPADTAYGVMALFFNAHGQRRDVDNMLKLILDGLNKVAWDDDSQVTEVSGRKSRDLPGHARTEVIIYTLGTIPRKVRPCKQCGKAIRLYDSTEATTVYCSNECMSTYRAAARSRICPTCSVSFDPGGTKRTYCSPECWATNRHADHESCPECDRIMIGATAWKAGERPLGTVRRGTRGFCETCSARHRRAARHSDTPLEPTT